MNLNSILRRETEESNDESSEDGEVEQCVDLVIHWRRYTTFTTHLGVAYYSSGLTKKFMFDHMKERDNAIVLYDYTDYKSRHMGKKPFVTISLANLNDFETVQRREIEVQYETQVELVRDVKLSEAKDKVEKYRNRDDVERVTVKGADL